MILDDVLPPLSVADAKLAVLVALTGLAQRLDDERYRRLGRGLRHEARALGDVVRALQDAAYERRD